MREKSDNSEVMRVELPSMGSQTCTQRRNHVQIYVTGVTFMLEACSRKKMAFSSSCNTFLDTFLVNHILNNP